MTQQYSLRWNNHQPNFISTFASLLSTRTLVDVTLAAEGQHMPAHKLVLCACSTYFQSLFTETPSQHPIVILKDVAFADLRILVDFMYFGQVNVTEEQLPQVLNTAKTLKIKGLTEMPESTSMTRSQSTSADFAEMPATPRAASSPPASPSSKRKRRRKSPTSTQIHLVGEEGRPPPDDAAAARNSIILSNVPQQQRRVDFLDEQAPQVDTHDLTVEPMNMEANAANAENMQQEECLLRVRRPKLLRRQPRVSEDRAELRKQTSEPAPAPSQPPLLKHESYPQYAKNRRARAHNFEVGSLLIRAVPGSDASTSADALAGGAARQRAPRASHTPAVRSGPPLSCNFCWNTVDESGRILRRKTQYHCPECRTNLCIVPCFHEYHDGPEAEQASAR